MSLSRRVLLIALPWLIVIAAWYAIAYSGLVNPSLVPTPHRVAARFWELLTTARLPLDIKEQFKAQKMFTSKDWKKLYADGTVTQWLQQVTDFFVRFGGIQNPVPASQYFDAKLYLETLGA